MFIMYNNKTLSCVIKLRQEMPSPNLGVWLQSLVSSRRLEGMSGDCMVQLGWERVLHLYVLLFFKECYLTDDRG